jgi:hypothetical protein
MIDMKRKFAVTFIYLFLDASKTTVWNNLNLVGAP